MPGPIAAAPSAGSNPAAAAAAAAGGEPMPRLPEEVLAHLFNILDPSVCFRVRRVCRAWRALAPAGCVRLQVAFPEIPKSLLEVGDLEGRSRRTNQHIWQMELAGAMTRS
eukprot:SAG22_NODE_3944_length_1456_cov_0.991157_2_plen_110_part_00